MIVLELALQTRLAWNLEICLQICLQSAEINGPYRNYFNYSGFNVILKILKMTKEYRNHVVRFTHFPNKTEVFPGKAA